MRAMPREEALALGEQVRALPSEEDGPLRNADSAALLGVPGVREIALAADMWREAGMWLGAEPRVIDVSAWVSEAGGEAALSQGWHRDMDDWRSCKQFIYLSDVGDEQGPHEFVPGSHREGFYEDRGLAPEQWFWGSGRVLPQAVVEEWPRMVVKGAAGTRWAANTYCWHRGRPVTSWSRVILSVCYGLTEFGHMREKMRMIRREWGM